MNSGMLTYMDGKFGVTQTVRSDSLYVMEGSLLASDAGMRELLDVYAPLMKALDLGAAGAYATGRLSSLCAAVQYMVAHDVLIDLSPERWRLELSWHEEGYCQFRYVLKDVQLLEGPDPGKREEWRERVLSGFYREQVRPFVEAVHRVSGMDTGHLWRLFPSRLRYAVDSFCSSAESSLMHEKYEDDWSFLTTKLEPEVFGRNRNPLDMELRTVIYPGKPGEPDKTLWMKTACCCYYHTEGGKYCYTCPRMSDREREERMEALRAEMV